MSRLHSHWGPQQRRAGDVRLPAALLLLAAPVSAYRPFRDLAPYSPGAVVLWTLIAFLSGSLPFSVWIGRLVARADIRRYGDGNPGATNAWRAGGWRAGVPALLLDYLKGATPVALARFGAGIEGWGLVPVALAPVLGHAFSPFLRFRGGKAIAVTFGIWSGLTLWATPTVMGLALVLLLVVLAPLALASGVLRVAVNTALTRSVWPEEVGGALGFSAALSSLTRVVAPTVGGFLLGRLGTWAPGALGAALMAWLVYYTWKRVLFVPDLACPVPREVAG